MDCARNIVGELVERSNEPEKFGEERTDDECGEKIPKEEIDDTGPGRAALFPSNAGMGKIGNEHGNGIGNSAG